jgi:hypothetical protein
MEKVIANLGASLERVRRRVIVTYFNPEHAGLRNRAGFLTQTARSVSASIYDTQHGTSEGVSPIGGSSTAKV